MIRNLVASLAIIFNVDRAIAQQEEYLPLHPGIVLESGDTWMDAGRRYRLYGVQSCLRGSSFTNNQGRKLDCGDVSLAFLAAFIKDLKPFCAPIVRRADLTYVVCFATVAGSKLDFGTILISRGYAFAGLGEDALPINPAYAVAEQQAKSTKAGLWQFIDVQHPAVVLSKRLRRNE